MFRIGLIAAVAIVLTAPVSADPTQAFSPYRGAPGSRLHGGGSPLAGRPAASSYTTHTGTYVINIAIAVKSSLATSPPISCSVALESFVETSSGAFATAFETGTVAAARSGSSATCRVSIPYAWQIPASGVISQTLTIEYGVDNVGAATTALARSSTQDLGVPYPANGATSTVSINAVI